MSKLIGDFYLCLLNLTYIFYDNGRIGLLRDTREEKSRLE